MKSEYMNVYKILSIVLISHVFNKFKITILHLVQMHIFKWESYNILKCLEVLMNTEVKRSYITKTYLRWLTATGITAQVRTRQITPRIPAMSFSGGGRDAAGREMETLRKGRWRQLFRWFINRQPPSTGNHINKLVPQNCYLPL